MTDDEQSTTEDGAGQTPGASATDEGSTAPAEDHVDSDADDDDGGPSSADYSLAFTPRQAAVGFAIVAGLVAFALRRRRRRRRWDD